MDRIVNTKEYLDQLISLLEQGQENLPVPVSGTSMTPFLHPGDTVYLSKAEPPLVPGDIVLYRRENGSYILHRIIRIGNSDTVWITGDNQTQLEPVQAKKQILAKVVAVRRRGQLLTANSFTWQFYRTIWRWLRPVRPYIGILHRITKAR